MDDNRLSIFAAMATHASPQHSGACTRRNVTQRAMPWWLHMPHLSVVLRARVAVWLGVRCRQHTPQVLRDGVQQGVQLCVQLLQSPTTDTRQLGSGVQGRAHAQDQVHLLNLTVAQYPRLQVLQDTQQNKIAFISLKMLYTIRKSAELWNNCTKGAVWDK